MSEGILYSIDGAVATLRFNRPEKKNALTIAMYDALGTALDDAARNPQVRSLAILGAQDFTAGNDIADFVAAGGLGDNPAPLRFLRPLADFHKPVIAGVRGAAIGIGVTLLMHCDAVVLSRTAKLALPFTKLGLVPEAGSSVLLPLIAGRMRAWWMLLSSESFGADDAERIGLATRVVDDAAVDATALAMCAQLAALPPTALATTKQLLKEPFAALIREAMQAEFAAFGAALATDETRAALMAFFKR